MFVVYFWNYLKCNNSFRSNTLWIYKYFKKVDSTYRFNYVSNIFKKNRKRGIVNNSIYKSEIIKKAGVSGSSYLNYAGKEISARKLGEDCKSE